MIVLKNIWLILGFLIVTKGLSQNKIEEINVSNKTHYITTEINYPVTGKYLFNGEAEPIIELNPNGTGIFQANDMTLSKIKWGIECFKEGTPIYSKGFNYAVYTLWYLPEDNLSENWTNVHFSIHFEKMKMYIMGDRIKDY